MERDASRRIFRLEQSPLEKVRLWVEIAAFAAAGCWALYTFAYQTRIAPAGVPGHENLSVSLHHLVSTASGSMENVRLTIRNDGTVDVDTAALALNVAGAAPSRLTWTSSQSSSAFVLHSPGAGSWHALQSIVNLFDGATHGRRGSHVVLRPGDTANLDLLVYVPRKDKLLQVQVETIYARYPIQVRIPARLERLPDGGMSFSTHNGSLVNFVVYFGVSG